MHQRRTLAFRLVFIPSQCYTGARLTFNFARKQTPVTLSSRVHQKRQNQFQDDPRVLTSRGGLDTHPA